MRGKSRPSRSGRAACLPKKPCRTTCAADARHIRKKMGCLLHNLRQEFSKNHRQIAAGDAIPARFAVSPAAPTPGGEANPRPHRLSHGWDNPTVGILAKPTGRRRDESDRRLQTKLTRKPRRLAKPQHIKKVAKLLFRKALSGKRASFLCEIACLFAMGSAVFGAISPIMTVFYFFPAATATATLRNLPSLEGFLTSWRTGKYLPCRAPRLKFSIWAVTVSPLAKLKIRRILSPRPSSPIFAQSNGILDAKSPRPTHTRRFCRLENLKGFQPAVGDDESAKGLPASRALLRSFDSLKPRRVRGSSPRDCISQSAGPGKCAGEGLLAGVHFYQSDFCVCRLCLRSEGLENPNRPPIWKSGLPLPPAPVAWAEATPR